MCIFAIGGGIEESLAVMSEFIESPEPLPGSTLSPESIPPGAVVTPVLSWARETFAEVDAA